MLVPHNPSRNLHRSTKAGPTVSPADLDDVHITEVDDGAEPEAGKPMASGRTLAMNPTARLPKD